MHDATAVHKRFGVLLGAARRAAGLTQVDLAAALGSYPGTVRNYEAGTTTPDAETKLALIRAFGLPESECLDMAKCAEVRRRVAKTAEIRARILAQESAIRNQMFDEYDARGVDP